MKAFKAYDIRGVYNKDFNKDDVYKVGFFLPRLLEAKTILIGRDVRESTDEIFDALCDGINDAGADVDSIGLSTTPMVYYTTAALKYDGSVMITASHNPKEYNGLKISRKNALPVGAESGLKELEQMVLNEPVKKVPEEERGDVRDIEVTHHYRDFLMKYVPENIEDLNLSIDCSNGMANIIVKELLGNTPHYLYDTLDGTFPNHEPNPLEEENVRDLKEAVLKNHSDLGIIFDGDADRVMFTDEKARFIQPDIITAVIGSYFLEKEKGYVIQDIRTSRSVTEYLEARGAKVFTWKVGHAYAKAKMAELNAIMGGELAGHYYFRDFYNCDSGFLACLIVLQVASKLKKENRSFSSLIDEIVTYATSGETNFKIEKKQEAMEALKSHFMKEQPTKVLDFDGYRIEFDQWWFNVRPSNTEPYLRLVVEAKSEGMLKEKLDELKSILSKYE
jgi:phosphomannomutase